MWVCGGPGGSHAPSSWESTHVHSVLVRQLGKWSLELYSQLLPVDVGLDNAHTSNLMLQY